MPQTEGVRLRQPFTIRCDSEADAEALHQDNRKITSRNGRVVTFHRTTWLKNVGRKPQPKTRTARGRALRGLASP